MEKKISIEEIKGIIRRRAKMFLLIFSSILFIAAVIAIALPPIYRSVSMLVIEAKKIPDEYVKSTINTYAIDRMGTTSRQIMKYSTLKSIIDEFGLYPELTEKGDYNKAVQEIKSAINLEPANTIETSSKDRNTATMAFFLSFEGRNPETVQLVTQKLASLYIEEESKKKEQLISVTTTFLEEELERLKKQIRESEKKISEFKQRNMGQLPENFSSNLQVISRLERELDQIISRVRVLQERKIYLKGQLANIEPLTPVVTEEGKVTDNPKKRLKSLRLALIKQQAVLSDKHPDIRKLKSEIRELEKQVGETDEAVEKIKLLGELNAKHAAMKGRLGEKHPDVVRIKKEIDLLSSQVDLLVTEQTSHDIAEEQPDNPAYINLITQIASADNEIKNLEIDKQNVQLDIKEHQEKIEMAPLVEKEYNELTMDHNNAKVKYNEVLNKLIEARFAEQMEVQQQGEQFYITEPAYLPTSPYKPNRLAIFLLGFVLAFSFAITITAIQEGSDDSIKSTDSLKILSGVPVFAELTFLETDEEKKTRHLKKTLWLIGSFGVLLMSIIIINIYIIPVQDLLVVIKERMNL